MTEVNDTAPTVIRVDNVSAPDLTPEQRQYLSITVQPGSLIGPDGQPLEDGQVGISTVPPELVRDMLPPGLMQHTYDITIQAPGAATFAVPAKLTFPNVFNAAPGTKLNILSFDHTTGRLVIEGTGTVSDDGKSVSTDPDTGITHPGWHGMTPPLNVSRENKPPKFPPGVKLLDRDENGRALPEGVFRKPEVRMENLDPRLYLRLEEIRDVLRSKLGPDWDLVLNSANDGDHDGEAHSDDRAIDISLRRQDGSLAYLDPSVVDQIGQSLRQQLPASEFDLGYRFPSFAGANQQAQATGGFPASWEPYINAGVPGWATFTDAWNHIHIQVHPQLRPFHGAPNSIVEATSEEVTAFATGQVHDFANNYVRITSVLGTFELRLRTDKAGNLPSFTLPPDSAYTIQFYDLFQDTIVEQEFWSGRAGTSFNAFAQTDSEFEPFRQLYGLSEYERTRSISAWSPAPRDRDADGLADQAEYIIGTSVNGADTDHDGINDRAELEQGLDPLDGRGFPTSVVASLPLAGEAKEVVLEGSILDPAGQTAYVATGSFGLAIVNASNFQRPLLLGQLDLPGDAVDVAVDSRLAIAAVAAGGGGLHLIDVSVGTRPALLRTIPVNAAQVEIVDGIAYTAVGGELRSYDLLTGERLQALPLGSSTITGIAREGSVLYTMDAGLVLRAVDLASGAMVARGTLTMPAGGGKLFVGGGVAYVGTLPGDFQGGFAIANVRNPDAITLLSGVDSNGIQGDAIITNGSGLGIGVGTIRFFVGGGQLVTNSTLDLLDVSNPSRTDQLLTSIRLPSTPFGVAIGAGIAFVADGTGGLAVVNYLSFDNRGLAPTVTISSTAADIDPGTPGIQITEGGLIQIAAAILDDVQVRNVELLINGQVVANDVSFPFDLAAVALGLDPLAPTVTVQVRATDTGGNSALSNELLFELVPDTFAPSIVNTSPGDGTSRNRGLRRIEIQFSEGMDESTISAETITLRDGVGQVIAPIDIQVRSASRIVQLTFDPLPEGDFELAFDAARLTDRAGNPLGSAPIVQQFTLTESTNRWIGAAGGSWNTASNWSEGRLPDALDNVVIDVAGTYQITTSTDIHVASLTFGAATGTQTLVTSRNLILDSESTIGRNAVIGLGSSSVLAIAGDLFVAGTLVNRVGGAIQGTGSLFVTQTGFVFLEDTTINFSVSNAGTLVIGGTNAFSGAFANTAVGTLRIQGDDNYVGALAASLTVANGMTNAGTIELTSTGNYWGNASYKAATLAVTAGTLVNTGTISVLSGTGGARALNAQIDNRNVLTVSASQGLILARAGADHVNSGTITVTGGNLAVTQSGDTPSFANTGTIDIANGRSLTFTGGRLALTSGNVTGQGSIRLSSLTLDTSTLTGTVTMQGVTVDAAASVINQGVLVALGNNTINGQFTNALGGTLRILGDDNYQGTLAASLTVADGMTNAGMIELTSTGNYWGNASYKAATLTVTAGTLTNTGSIRVLSGTGGNRSLTVGTNGSLVNASGGVITADERDYTITLSGTNQGLTNNGLISVAAGRTLTVTGSLFSPGNGTISGAGTLQLSSAIVGSGALTGNVSMTGVTVAEGASLVNEGLLVVRSTNSFNGQFTNAAGGTLRILGDDNYQGTLAASLTVADGMTNAGMIELTSTGNYWGNASYKAATLTVTAGTLVNTGTISVLPGTGGARALNAQIDNRNVLTVSASQGLSLSRAGADHVNSGTINVTGGNLTVTQSGDTPSFANTGTIDIASGWSLIFTGGRLALTSGNVTGQGLFRLASLTLDTSTLTGTVTMQGVTVDAAASVVNQGVLVALGTSNTINGQFTNAAGGMLRILGDDNYQGTLAASLTVANGMTNAGTIELTSQGNYWGQVSYKAATLVVTGGVLTNMGAVRVLLGTGGNRSITIGGNASMANAADGTIYVSDRDYSIALQGTGTNPRFTNAGEINVTAGRALTVTGSVFVPSTGTISGAGALVLSNATLGSGRLTGNVSMTGVTLAQDALLVNEGVLVALGTSNTINGQFTNAAGGTLRILGDDNYLGTLAASLAVANGMTNAGTIELTSQGNYWGQVSYRAAILAVTAGTLVNTGTISVLSGTGGARALNAQLDNRNVLTDSASQGLSLSRAGADHVNSGTINVTGGNLTVTQSGTTPSFTNTGTIQIDAGRVLAVNGGTFEQTSAGRTTVSLAGTTQFGRLAVTGAASLAGTLEVALTGGFVPALGNNFGIVTYASRTGTFGTLVGAELPNGLVLTPAYGATSLVLTAANPLMAEVEAGMEGLEALTEAEARTLLAAAIERWGAAGLDQLSAQRLAGTVLRIEDLPGVYLATAAPADALGRSGVVTIDATGAGHGWFVDATPEDDLEFAASGGGLDALSGSLAAGRFDLFSVLEHELGHLLGLEDLDPADHAGALMAATLELGSRRAVDVTAVDEAFSAPGRGI